MSSEPSDFEKWERAARLRIELIQAFGDVAKKYAEAARENAKAQNIGQRNQTIAQINKEVFYLLRQRKQAEYRIRHEYNILRDKIRQVSVLKSCREVSKTSIAQAWSSLQWFMERVPSLDLQKIFSQEWARRFVVWMQERQSKNELPILGSPGYTLLLNLLEAIDKSQTQQVQELEEWSTKVKTQVVADLAPLQQLLGIAKEL